MSVIKAETVKMETVLFPFNQISQSMNIINATTEGTQCTSETLEDNRVGDCAKEDISSPYREGTGDWKDTAIGMGVLAEPEPLWTEHMQKSAPRLNHNFIKEKNLATDEELWRILKLDLAYLRERAFQKAGNDFDARVRSLIGG